MHAEQIETQKGSLGPSREIIDHTDGFDIYRIAHDDFNQYEVYLEGTDPTNANYIVLMNSFGPNEDDFLPEVDAEWVSDGDMAGYFQATEAHLKRTEGLCVEEEGPTVSFEGWKTTDDVPSIALEIARPVTLASASESVTAVGGNIEDLSTIRIQTDYMGTYAWEEELQSFSLNPKNFSDQNALQASLVSFYEQTGQPTPSTTFEKALQHTMTDQHQAFN